MAAGLGFVGVVVMVATAAVMPEVVLEGRVCGDVQAVVVGADRRSTSTVLTRSYT